MTPNRKPLEPIEPLDLGPIEPIDLGPIRPLDLGPIEPLDLGPIEPLDAVLDRWASSTGHRSSSIGLRSTWIGPRWVRSIGRRWGRWMTPPLAGSMTRSRGDPVVSTLRVARLDAGASAGMTSRPTYLIIR